MTVTPDDAIDIQFREIGRRVKSVEEGKANRRDVDNLSRDVQDLKVEVKSMRRALVGFSFTVAGSAIMFAFAVIQFSGGGA